MLPKVCRMNHKNFVFALLKTIQKQAGRNSGRILRLFNCYERVFRVRVRVGVCVGVGVWVAVRVRVRVGVGVQVEDWVRVRVRVRVGVGVAVRVGIRVRVRGRVSVGVGIGVGVRVTVQVLFLSVRVIRIHFSPFKGELLKIFALLRF